MRVAEVDPTQLASLLDREERLRAARLARPSDRLSYLAAHTLLRLLLGARLGVPPQDVAYLREPCPRCGAPHGRPALDCDRRLHFSLSRSAGLVLIGIAPAPVGVDVEVLPPPETIADVSALLHAAERKEVLSAAPTRRAHVFATIWTRKEAYLKGIGVGIAADLATDYLGVDGQANTPKGWSVINVPVAAGYAAAAAIMQPESAQSGCDNERARSPTGREVIPSTLPSAPGTRRPL